MECGLELILLVREERVFLNNEIEIKVAISQWAKSPKKAVCRSAFFDNMALNFERRINCFLAILPTGIVVRS